MEVQIQAALISAAISLIAAISSIIFNIYQIRREKKKWLFELKTSYSEELYKARLATYPRVFQIVGNLSHAASERVTPEKAREIAGELNDWNYSAGGLCADKRTRGALLGLRQACLEWGTSENMPYDLYQWRNILLLYLRNDLDLKGLEEYDPSDRKSLLLELQSEATEIK